MTGMVRRDEVVVGRALAELRVQVDAQAMKPMALLLRDPNPIHLDPAVVEALGFGDRVINQGPLNAAYIWDMLVRTWGDAARVRQLDLRYTSNALAGDELVVGGEITEVDPDTGTATCAVWLRRDDGRDVVTGRATVEAEEV